MSENHKGDKKPKNKETLWAITYFSHVGITMAASVIIGVIIGSFLDDLIGTSPWLLLIFSILGIGAAFKNLFSMFNDKE